MTVKTTTVKMTDFVRKTRASVGLMSNSDKDEDKGKIRMVLLVMMKMMKMIGDTDLPSSSYS